jgi:curli production assembly/transport component CsgG
MKVGFMISVTVTISLLLGCAGVEKSFVTTRPTKLNVTSTHKDLISLPAPQEKIVVGVYKFQDQTGQFKPKENATSFSTAVTQGGTSMLMKALVDSGWFIPAEREGLPNLLNERKIIQSTLMQNASENGGMVQNLPPLLFSSILMEGGIISYETNVVTGGLGAEYFGVGGKAETRRDQVTIYLRAVSVKNGQVVANVSTTKAILSQQIGFSLFRYISYQRLLEAEMGVSTNEPPQMAVLEAIERAVIELIVQGIRDGLWNLKNPEDMENEVIQRYILMQEGLEVDQNGELIVQKDANGQKEKRFTLKR